MIRLRHLSSLHYQQKIAGMETKFRQRIDFRFDPDPGLLHHQDCSILLQVLLLPKEATLSGILETCDTKLPL